MKSTFMCPIVTEFGQIADKREKCFGSAMYSLGRHAKSFFKMGVPPLQTEAEALLTAKGNDSKAQLRNNFIPTGASKDNQISYLGVKTSKDYNTG